MQPAVVQVALTTNTANAVRSAQVDRNALNIATALYDLPERAVKLVFIGHCLTYATDYIPLIYFCFRIIGVNVTPISNPSGDRSRLTVCPHGSFLFFRSILYPRDSSSAVAFSTLSTSNSSHP